MKPGPSRSRGALDYHGARPIAPDSQENLRTLEEYAVSRSLDGIPFNPSPANTRSDHSLSVEYGRNGHSSPPRDFSSLASMVARPGPHIAADYGHDVLDDPRAKEHLERYSFQTGEDSLGLTGLDISQSSLGHHASNLTFRAGLVGKPSSPTRSNAEYDHSRDVRQLDLGGDMSALDAARSAIRVRRSDGVRRTRLEGNAEDTPRPVRTPSRPSAPNKGQNTGYEARLPPEAYSFYASGDVHAHEEDEGRSASALDPSVLPSSVVSPTTSKGSRVKLADALGGKFSPNRPRNVQSPPRRLSPMFSGQPPDIAQPQEASSLVPSRAVAQQQHPVSAQGVASRVDHSPRPQRGVTQPSSHSAPTAANVFSARGPAPDPRTTSSGSSGFGKLARGLQSDIAAEQAESARTHTRYPRSEVARHGPPEGVTKGQAVAESRRREPPFSTAPLNSAVKPTGIVLPDVTGLTSAVATPAKVDASYKHARTPYAPAVDVQVLGNVIKEQQTRLRGATLETAETQLRAETLEVQLKRAVQRLEDNKQRAADRSMELRSEIETERRKYAEWEGRGKADSRRVEDTERKLQEAEERARILDERCSALIEQNKSLESIIVALRTDLEKVNKDCREHKAKLQELQSEKERYEREVQDALGLSERQYSELQAKRMEVEVLQTKLQRTMDEIARLKIVIAAGLSERTRLRCAQAQAEDEQRREEERLAREDARMQEEERLREDEERMLAEQEERRREREERMIREEEEQQELAMMQAERIVLERKQLSAVTEEEEEEEEEDADMPEEDPPEEEQHPDDERAHHAADRASSRTGRRMELEIIPELSSGSASSRNTPFDPPEPVSPRFNESFHNTSGVLSEPSFAGRKSPVEDDAVSALQEEVSERRSFRAEGNDNARPDSAVGREKLEARLKDHSRSSTPQPMPHSPSPGPPAPPPSRVGSDRRPRAGPSHDRNNATSPSVPRIRSQHVERLFHRAPDHHKATCTTCHRRASGSSERGQPSAIDAAWLAHAAAKVGRPGSSSKANVGQDHERLRALHDISRDERLPPQTVLARVIRELEDDFTHYKAVYVELAEQYALMDAATNKAKRNVLADHLREVINVLEQKGDHITALYDLLSFADQPLPDPDSAQEQPSRRGAGGAQ